MLSEPAYLRLQRLPDFEERNVGPAIEPAQFTTHHCGYCGVAVDHVETANPNLPVMVADKGTNTAHWRKCPKQAWKWKLQHRSETP